jgi:hypothetical protein
VASSTCTRLPPRVEKPYSHILDRGTLPSSDTRRMSAKLIRELLHRYSFFEASQREAVNKCVPSLFLLM